MPRPQLALVLHAHLPWVRHPEEPQFHEESWLFEALIECYLPLCEGMRDWTRRGWPWRLALSVSPTLAASLSDALLRERFERHFSAVIELAGREVDRHLVQPDWRAVAEFYRERLTRLRNLWWALGGEVLAEWRRLQESGHLELFTCSATHAILPFLKESPITLHAQIAVALSEHQRHFGSPPAGFWLPECAFVPELEPVLAEHGVHWTLLETHGLLHATPAPQAAIFAPVLGPHGVAFFGRDPASARQVWSRQGGYPGDPRYREFHRDLAHEAEREYLGAWQTDDASDPTFTGLKYHAVTGDGDFKAVYRRDAALDAVRDHAAHFVRTRCEWAARAESESPLPDGRPVLCVAPYDAELFGHWWFEGPEFLGEIMRLTAEASSPLELVTPGQHLARYPRCERVQPAASSWGEHGHLSAWLDPRNVWMQSPQRVAEARLARLAAVRETVSERARAVRQAWRELLLMQASDWPFLLRHETAGDYPRRRFTEHHQAFQRLADMLEAVVPWDADFLREREQRHPLFPEPEGHERFVQESGTTA